MGKPNPQNLNPCNSENARERQLKSAEKRKENNAKKKLMSQIYADILEKKYKVGKDGKKKTGYEVVGDIAMQILARKDASSVSMLREIREATEGKTLNINADVKAEMLTTEDLISEYKELAGLE